MACATGNAGLGVRWSAINALILSSFGNVNSSSPLWALPGLRSSFVKPTQAGCWPAAPHSKVTWQQDICCSPSEKIGGLKHFFQREEEGEGSSPLFSGSVRLGLGDAEQCDGAGGRQSRYDRGCFQGFAFSSGCLVCLGCCCKCHQERKKKKGFKRSYKLFHFLCEFCNPSFVQRGGEKPEPSPLGWTPFLSRCAGAWPGLRAPGMYHYVGFCGRGWVLFPLASRFGTGLFLCVHSAWHIFHGLSATI